MGSCKSCNKKDQCSSPKTNIPSPSRPRYQQEIDIREYLKPLPSDIHLDPTPLSQNCTHTVAPKYKRYQCLTCMRQWVYAVSEEEIKEAIEKMKEKRTMVAAERLEDLLKEKKARMRIE